MTNTKVTPMTGVTSNGKKQLIENLNRMVLPEMLLNRLNRDILQHRNELQTALDSLLSGQKFLKLLRQRTLRVIMTYSLMMSTQCLKKLIMRLILSVTL